MIELLEHTHFWAYREGWWKW